MAVAQVGDAIRLALQELEVLQAGDNPSAQEYTDATDWLNVMISNWEADESLSMRPNLLTDSFLTVASTGSYTCMAGTGTAFLYRPIRVINAYSIHQDVSRQLGILSKSDYNLIVNKITPGMPHILYYTPGTTGEILFDRVPDAVYTIVCDLQAPIGDYADQNDPLAVSPEYRAAIIYNLAVVLAPSYKVALRPQTAHFAKLTRERIQYQAHNAQAILPTPSSTLIV